MLQLLEEGRFGKGPVVAADADAVRDGIACSLALAASAAPTGEEAQSLLSRAADGCRSGRPAASAQLEAALAAAWPAELPERASAVARDTLDVIAVMARLGS